MYTKKNRTHAAFRVLMICAIKAQWVQIEHSDNTRSSLVLEYWDATKYSDYIDSTLSLCQMKFIVIAHIYDWSILSLACHRAGEEQSHISDPQHHNIINKYYFRIFAFALFTPYSTFVLDCTKRVIIDKFNVQTNCYFYWTYFVNLLSLVTAYLILNIDKNSN